MQLPEKMLAQERPSKSQKLQSNEIGDVFVSTSCQVEFYNNNLPHHP